MSRNFTWQGVLALSYEFLITIAIVLGGGFLIFHNVQVPFVVGIISIVVTFWFTGSKKTMDQSQNVPQLPQQPDPQPAPTQVPVVQQTIQSNPDQPRAPGVFDVAKK